MSTGEPSSSSASRPPFTVNPNPAHLLHDTGGAAAHASPRVLDLEKLLREDRGPIMLGRDCHIECPVVVRSCTFKYRVELRGVVFHHRVDLRDMTFLRTVDLRECDFRGGLLLEGACVGGSLLMHNAIIGVDSADLGKRAARLQSLRVRGDLLAHGLCAQGGVDLTGAGIRGKLELWSVDGGRRAEVQGPLRLSAARINGDVRLDGLQLHADLDAEGVRIGGRLYLGPLREKNDMDSGAVLLASMVRGNIRLSVARIVGELNLNCVRVRGAVHIQTAEIRGGVFCRCKYGHRAIIQGPFRALGARVGGTFDCSGAELHSLLLEGATIVGVVFLSDGAKGHEGLPPGKENASDRPDLRTIVHGQVALSQMRVTGSVDLIDAQLYDSVVLNSATVTGYVNMGRIHLARNLDLRSASVRGGFMCRCSDGTRPYIGGDVLARAASIGSGVHVVGADLRGNVDFTGAVITGVVEFRRGCMNIADSGLQLCEGGPTRIGGGLDLSDAVVAGALEAQGLQTGGELRLARTDVRGWVELRQACIRDPGARAIGTASAVHAVGLRTGDALRLGNADFHGWLNLQHARIGGGLLAGTLLPVGGDAGIGMRVQGALYLDAAAITGTADFRGANIGGELSLERCDIEGKLRCRLVDFAASAGAATTIESLDLRNARVRHLDLDGNEPQSASSLAKVPILLDGCTFQELSVPGGDYAGVLEGYSGSFRPSSHLAMETWLRNRGDDDAAEKVHDGRRRRRRKDLTGLRWSLDAVAGAARKVALRFDVLIAVSVVSYLVTSLVFSTPRSVVPKESGAAASRVADAAPRTESVLGAGSVIESGSALAPSRPSAPGRVPDSKSARGAGSAAELTSATAKPQSPPRWGWSDGLLFAAQVHLPMLNLPSRDRWHPARRPIHKTALTLRFDAYATILALLSYIVVPLIIGGVATTWLQQKGRT